MHLYLVRHGLALEADRQRWPDDTGRPLSPEGEEEFRRAAKGLKLLAPTVDVVLCSPLVRAQQTAVILETEAGWATARLHEPLGGGTPEEILASLENVADANSISLIGHDPFLGWTASLLIAGAAEAAAIKMGTGSVAHLDVQGLQPGAGKLVGLYQSSDLARM